MSIDITYIKSAVETLNLIQRLTNYSIETQTMDKLTDYLSQIESKGDARVSSSLGQQLGIDVPVADQEGKSTKYWEGVRDMARLAKKQFLTLRDNQKFIQFINNTSVSLSARLAPEEKPVSPLEELLQEPKPVSEIAQPVSPLEEMLTEPTPIAEPVPAPTPIAEPVPTPTPIAEPVPAPTPIAEPVPTPTPIAEPVPTPTPIPDLAPTTETAPAPTQIPKPTSIPDLTSITEPTLAPTPVKTTATETQPTSTSVPPPPDKFQALDEALKTSGLSQPAEEVSEPAPSLTSMLLQKDEVSDKEEDDMLSLSLREALKILRDEDED